MNVTLEDIARLAGANPSTVSRVLNRPPHVSISEKRSRRILSLARKLNYQPRHSARSLATGKSYCIGAILGTMENDLSSPYTSLILAGMIRSLAQNGYLLCFLPIAEGKVCDEEVLLAIQRGKCDGFFIGSGMIGNKTLKELARQNVPVVVEEDHLLFATSHHVNGVKLDFQPAVEELAGELVRRGHRRVAYMTPVCLDWKSRRYSCVQSALAAHGIHFSDDDLIKYWPERYETLSERREAQQAADREMERILRYSVIVGGNDLVALGIGDALKKRGMEPGRDISLVGFDNLEENPSFPTKEPFLTTIDLGFKERGCQLAEVLVQRIQHPEDKPQAVTVPARLIVRKSLTNAGKAKRSSAFTLVELLIVMALLSVLAAMLLPALRGALEVGRRAKCIGQMRQLGQAVAAYVNDYDGWLPMVRSDVTPPGSDASMKWITNQAFLRNLGIRLVYESGWKSSNMERLVCPSDKSPYVDTYYAYQTSYAFNINLGNATFPYWHRMEEFAKPGGLCLAFEARGKFYYDAYMSAPGTTYGDKIPYLHGNGANVLYLDGHVAWHEKKIPYRIGGAYYPSQAAGMTFWEGQ
ncbi:MAG: substrate-binding domain-containing protein [Verrucomicrobiae bacterium]|nr:substrate-binding domain-containing protein [Verrucomicrobiae bacterium]